MIVVSDATPLITLMKVSELAFLGELFGEVLIPEAVFSEVTENSSFQNEARMIQQSSFIQVVSVQDRERVSLIQRVTGLDLGETEAIVYADEVQADVILIDERKARQVAQNMNLPISGSMGVLIGALEKGLISVNDADMIVDTLRKSNQHISDKLLELFSAKAHETTKPDVGVPVLLKVHWMKRLFLRFSA